MWHYLKSAWENRKWFRYIASLCLWEIAPQVSNHFMNKKVKFGQFFKLYRTFCFISRAGCSSSLVSHHIISIPGNSHINKTTLKAFLCYIRHIPSPHVSLQTYPWLIVRVSVLFIIFQTCTVISVCYM